MDKNMQVRLDNYFELFQEINQRVNDEKIALSLLQEAAKDRRTEEIREERDNKNGEQATPKQLQYLKSLGIKAQPGLTKKEASMLIDEELGKNNDE